MAEQSEPKDNPTEEMRTALKKSELLGKINARLQLRISEANKLFKKWQSARDINLQAESELADYLTALRRCDRLQRVERKLTA
jgi:hypothetical protein